MSSFGNLDGLSRRSPVSDSQNAGAPLLEVCASSVASARAALEGGADRIEFCRNLRVGGLTPDRGEIERLAETFPLPVHVLVRPRAGDFVYGAEEFARVLEEVRLCRAAGAAGVVTGCLTPSGDPDVDRMRRVIDAADGLHVTFHRAFDQVRNPFEAMDRLAEIGVARILTSGGRADVIQGAATLRKWVERADVRLEIMPGGGIRVENLPDLHRAVGARSYHASLQAPLASETADSASSEGVTDPELVRRAKEILSRL